MSQVPLRLDSLEAQTNKLACRWRAARCCARGLWCRCARGLATRELVARRACLPLFWPADFVVGASIQGAAGAG